jgi:cytochrome b561
MTPPVNFHPLARLLHWTMAVLILSMLFIGVGMVTTVSPRHQWLLAIHKPLGIAILLLAVIRLAVRMRLRPPALPADMPVAMQWLAHASHWLLYALMLAMPLIGWAMLSAGGYPIMLGSFWHLPPIVPANAALYAWLREAHGYLAFLLFLTVLGHMAAALYHALIRRDSVFPSMTFGNRPVVEVTVEPVECIPSSEPERAPMQGQVKADSTDVPRNE